MANRWSISTWRVSACCVLVALAASGLLSGCGGDGTPTTAENSKFRPSDAPGEKTNTAPVDPAVSPMPANSNTFPGTEPRPQAPATNPGDNVASNTNPPTKPGTQPPEGAGDGVPVVSAEVEAWFGLIEQLKGAQPQGQTEEETLRSLWLVRHKIIELCVRILNAPADPRVHRLALQEAQVALTQLAKLKDPSVVARMTLFGQAVAKHPDKELARVGRLLAFNMEIVEDLQPGPDGKIDTAAILKKVQGLLDEDEADEDTFGLTNQVWQILNQAGESQAAADLMRAIAKRYENYSDPRLANAAKSLPDSARIVELNLTKTFREVMGKKEGAEDKLVADITKLLDGKNPNPVFIEPIMDLVRQFEALGKGALVQKLYGVLETAYSTHENPEAARIVTEEILTPGRKRYGLVGKPFAPQATTLDGQALDLKSLQGKVVLVTFWATIDPSSFEEFPILRKLQGELKDKGFEVLGLSVDAKGTEVRELLKLQESFIPFTVYVSPEVVGNDKVQNWRATSLAKEFGLTGLPFYLIVGKDGNVDSIHHFQLDQDQVGERLKVLLDLKEAPILAIKPQPMTIINPTVPGGATPAPAPVPVEPPAEAGTPAPPAKAGAPAPKDQGRVLPLESRLYALMSPAGWFSFLAAEDTPPAKEAAPVVPAETNPYLAKPGQTSAQLTDWVLRMLDKPKTIQKRPGFTAAVVDACDRILADKVGAKEVEQFVAIENKLEALHRAACADDAECDKQLAAFVALLKDDTRPRVARGLDFFLQERKVLDACANAELKQADVANLLQELKEYFAQEKLAGKHLRMASGTVELINKLEDGDAREEHFTGFGQTFGKSTDKELARYGKRLAKKPGVLESDLVGKPLELVAKTFAGDAFSWEKYRGKVVLVDFWATWCGPCRKELPNVVALREQLKDQGFEVVGVSVDKDLEALGEFLDEHKLPWETLAGEEAQDVADKYGVRGIPTMMLVDQKGVIVAVSHSSGALRPHAEKLLKK